MPLLVDSSIVRSRLVDTGQASLLKGDRVMKPVSTLPNLQRSDVRRRSPGCAIGSFCGPIWRDTRGEYERIGHKTLRHHRLVPSCRWPKAPHGRFQTEWTFAFWGWDNVR